jgi:hypothetical protein
MNVLVSEYSFNNRYNLLQFNFKMSILFRIDLVLKSICLPGYGSLKVHLRFGVTRRLHFQGSRVAKFLLVPASCCFVFWVTH